MMRADEIKNMDFEQFKAALNSMEEVKHLEATGNEVYGIYKHDVCYVERNGVKRTLQMIVPESRNMGERTYPAILYVQGSAWLQQDQYKRLGVMARLAQRGFVTAILQYRESDLATFPAQIEDAKTGIRFLRKYAQEYHINPEEIFLMGDSSGGHTAMMAALTADEDILDTDVYKEFSCKVKAIIDLYGVSDICQKGDFPTTLNQGEPDSPEGKLIGRKNVYEYPEISNKVNCANYVRKEVPTVPILMMHGTADDMVSCNQSIRLYKKLREEEKDVTFYLMKNAIHGDVAFWTEDTMDIIESFIRKQLENGGNSV